ncbi:hypothetical protein D9O36_17015 [Zobellia amurskyensis]|uniref:Uncharacterized protein n=1 Tax=Zobellia amurskyensis TaxID=248905 RepID=A0A7X2ZWA4_9FLAO|nr:DUF5677 domain-containing protein [Zobellia amurskyensis]MUH37552.1 hypothetical protein [Zobellia amurskyensis]
MENLEDLNVLINYYVDVGNSISGKKVKGQEGIKYAESISKKTFLHICTSYSLCQRQKFDLIDGSYFEVIDYSSIAVLIRAALESYLVFNHVFVAPEDHDEKLYRYHCWDLAGYIERQDLQATSQESLAIKNQEKILIGKKISIIREFEYHVALSAKQKKQMEKGNWKSNLTWTDLAENAGFERGFFGDLYSYLCSYSHTGRLSVLQITKSKKIEEQEKFGKDLLQYALIILSKNLYDYVELIPQLKPVYEKDVRGKRTVELWKEVGEKLKKQEN